MEHSICQKLEAKKTQAQKLILQLDALSPLKTLIRGYSIISSKEGKIIKNITKLKQGDEIQIRMQDGEAKAKIL